MKGTRRDEREEENHVKIYYNFKNKIKNKVFFFKFGLFGVEN